MNISYSAYIGKKACPPPLPLSLSLLNYGGERGGGIYHLYIHCKKHSCYYYSLLFY